ncbi:hypothetical protein BDR04DRAFT_1108481 [Suillus decipiens]|nr:hypothetical protein BDR04DRAFT_1108481 [Suillus decipiens]
MEFDADDRGGGLDGSICSGYRGAWDIERWFEGRCMAYNVAKDSVLKGSGPLPGCASDFPHIDMRVRQNEERWQVQNTTHKDVCARLYTCFL